MSVHINEVTCEGKINGIDCGITDINDPDNSLVIWNRKYGKYLCQVCEEYLSNLNPECILFCNEECTAHCR